MLLSVCAVERSFVDDEVRSLRRHLSTLSLPRHRTERNSDVGAAKVAQCSALGWLSRTVISARLCIHYQVFEFHKITVFST